MAMLLIVIAWLYGPGDHGVPRHFLHSRLFRRFVTVPMLIEIARRVARVVMVGVRLFPWAR